MVLVKDMLKALHKEDREIITIDETKSIIVAAKLMRDHNIGSLPVMSNNQVVGVISERDIVFRAVASASGTSVDRSVRAYMTTNPESVSLETNLMDVLNLMEERNFRHVLVLEKGKLMGIISMRDVLYALMRNNELINQNLSAYIKGN